MAMVLQFLRRLDPNTFTINTLSYSTISYISTLEHEQYCAINLILSKKMYNEFV